MNVQPLTTRQTAALPARRISEETLNQWTHGFGLILAILGALALAATAAETNDASKLRAAAVYSTTLVALFAASTLSHSFLLRPRLRHFFRMADQVCIFLLIAGTYTPFGLVYLAEGWTSGLTIAIWSLALFGSFFKVFFSYLQSLGTTSYLVLGWLPVTAMGEMFVRVPTPAVTLLIVGGLLYTVGTIFLLRDHKPYFHAVWHLMVVAASSCHFWAIFAYVVA